MLSVSLRHSRQHARTPIVFMWERFSQPRGCLRPLCKIWFSTSHLTHIEVVNLICRVNHQPDSKQFNQSCPSIMNVMIVVVLGKGCLHLIASGYGYTQITQCTDLYNPKLVVFLSRFWSCSLTVNISCSFLQSGPLQIYIYFFKLHLCSVHLSVASGCERNFYAQSAHLFSGWQLSLISWGFHWTNHGRGPYFLWLLVEGRTSGCV